MRFFVAGYLGNKVYTDLNAGSEIGCFNISGGGSAMGAPIAWDVIHVNEGLHSLYPRVNTSAELAEWAAQLGGLADLLKAGSGSPTLIYATMTPFMPEK